MSEKTAEKILVVPRRAFGDSCRHRSDVRIVSDRLTLALTSDEWSVPAGMDRIAAQDGDGGYTVRLGNPGVNVPGATVPVVLSGSAPFKGMLLFATDHAETKPLGAWASDRMPDGCQVHPQCSYAVTHDAFHNVGAAENVVPWIAPADLKAGQVVKFKVTVVRDYETWFAFETAFTVGSARGGGEDGLTLAAPSAGRPGGVRAPSMGAAVQGGWRAPDKTTSAPEPVGQKLAQTVQHASGGRRADAGAAGTKTKNEFVAASRAKAERRVARVAHGLVMALCWLALAPGAALVARHGRSAPWWFRFHRAAAAAAVAATLASAWYIVAARGWATPWGRHGTIGAVVCGLAVLQAAGGYLRKRFPRAPWAVAHRGVGAATLAGGAYNCLVGAGLLGAMEPGMRRAYPLACAAVATVAMMGAVMEVQRKRRTASAKLARTL